MFAASLVLPDLFEKLTDSAREDKTAYERALLDFD